MAGGYEPMTFEQHSMLLEQEAQLATERDETQRAFMLEQEEMRSMSDVKEPLCPKCLYNPEAQGKYERMKKIFKPNAKPASKDGSWGFSK